MIYPNIYTSCSDLTKEEPAIINCWLKDTAHVNM